MITIAWDVDDVLNNLTADWLVDSKIQDGELATFSVNPPHEILGISKADYLASLDEFRQRCYAQLEPEPMFLDWFQENGDKYHSIVLTAVPYQSASRSAEWVIRNFGRWIRSFNYVPSFRAYDVIPDYHSSKGDFLDWFGDVDLFIDDSEENIEKARAFGIKSLLFPRPWNRNCEVTAQDFLKELDEALKYLERGASE